jgi:uncharacterized membrane protein (DUF441 family)
VFLDVLLLGLVLLGLLAESQAPIVFAFLLILMRITVRIKRGEYKD